MELGDRPTFLAAMSLKIKAVVENFVAELKVAMASDLQDRALKERELKSYLEEREREIAERESAWKADLARREVFCAILCPLMIERSEERRM